MSLISTDRFLKHILPHEGWYCGVLFFKGGRVQQLWCHTPASLAQQIQYYDSIGVTAYHACASYMDKHRKRELARAARSLWADVDAGEGKPYRDAAAAQQATRTFVDAVGIPEPCIVFSGNGLHLYWPFTHDLDPETWHRYALGLKAAAQQHGFVIDPARTADISSILRPPGTHHRKDPNHPKPVQTGQLAGPFEASQFAGLLNHAAVLGRNVPLHQPRARKLADALADTSAHEPRFAGEIARECAQLRRFVEKCGVIPEPDWHACLGVLAFCADGEDFAHQHSAGDPRYQQRETADKLARTSALTGATTCQRFHALNPQACETCKHWGAITSPISLGKREAPAPSESRTPAENSVTWPELPRDFYWNANHGLITKTEGRGGVIDIVISQFPIFLDAVQSGEAGGEINLAFRQFLPHEGWLDILLPARTMFGPMANAELAAKGANIQEPQLFLKYVRAAMVLHHRQMPMTTRYDKFGWKNNDTAFLWGNELYTATGVQRVTGSPDLQLRASEHDGKPWLGHPASGSLEAWKRQIERMFVAGMEPHAFVIIAAFGAILLRFADPLEGGAVIHLVSVDSGTGKTNALLSAASVWGQLDGLRVINKDTQVAKALTLALLNNLPVIHDELVLRDPDVIKDFVIDFTEGRDKKRGTIEGQLRPSLAQWQTLLLSAANTSLVDVLISVDKKKAAGWRVMEFRTELPRTLPYFNNAEFKSGLINNAGTAGQRFLQWLLQPANLQLAKVTLAKVQQQLWKKTGYPSDARFWIRTLACVATAGWLVSQLKIIEFNPDRLMSWALANLPTESEMGAERDYWSGSALGEFFHAHIDAILVVQNPYVPHVEQFPIRPPKGKLIARFELNSGRCYVACAALREWLVRRELSYTDVINDLKRKGAVINERRQVTLSAGCREIPGFRIWAVELNLHHPAVSNVVPDAKDNVIPFKAPVAAPPPGSSGLSPEDDQTVPDA